MPPFAFRTASDLRDLGGAAARYTKNMTALRLLHTITTSGRTPETLTEQEQRILAQYTAFADSEVLKRAFVDAAKTDQEASERFTANDEIAALVSDDAQASLRRTALTAFYTPLPIIAVIWQALQRLGLDSMSHPRILEPAAGVGNFLSMLPAPIRQRAEITAVELDTVSAQIFARLHPDIRLFGGVGFEHVSLPQQYFDLVIGNVPFSEIGVVDRTLEPFLTRTLHDYFFAKALTLVRPGGIMALLTSYGTLDKVDPRVRNWLSERAQLLAALRLPNGVFSANAGTEAGADLLIVQRATETTEMPSWPHSRWITLPQADEPIHLTTGSRYGRSSGPSGAIRISQHFTEHPDDVIGRMYVVMKRGTTWLYVAPPETAPDQALAQRLALLPAGMLVPYTAAPPILHQQASTNHQSLTIADQLSGADAKRAQAMLEMYQAAKHVIQDEIQAAPSDRIAQSRQRLNICYDLFVRQYGVLHARSNRRILTDLPELSFLLALETDVHERGGRINAQKAPIFTHATVRPTRATTEPISAQDALLVCLDACGQVDLDRIAALANMTRDTAKTALHGLIYRLPDPHTERYVTADAYLSGNIREKLRDAQAMATLDPTFHEQIAALEAALPTPLTPAEITANLGASWIPAEDVIDFIRSILPSFRYGHVRYHPPLARWELQSDLGAAMSVDATTTWGTQRMDALQIIDETLNGRLVQIYDIWEDHGSEKRRLNETETLAAQDKQTQIKDRFRAWLWEDADRAERLAALYNERYNSVRLRQYDGSHLSLPGMNTHILRNGDLARWQKDAIWQALQNQTTLIGHVVGAGKTFEMLAIAHEARRMGVASKPLVIVPNHLVEQWAQEAQRLYPGTRVLAMTPEDFGKTRRGIYLSKIVTGSWDLIIVAHTSFTLLPVASSTLQQFTNKRIQALRRFLEEVRAEQGQRRTMKEIEKRIAKLELKLAQRDATIIHDDQRTITWDELGIDLLLVDEAHAFKNLEIETRMDRVAGVPRGGSQRAFDLWIKTWDLLRRGGKVVFATGTPVANTLAEVFVMMRYLQNDLLERLGLDQFDAWVATFAQTHLAFELRPDGSGYRMNTRLSRFVNLPELATLWRQCLNVRTAEQLNLPRPRLATGKPIPVVIPASPRLKAFVAQLVERVEQIKNRQVEPNQDNMLLITSQGRLAALDIRLVLGGPEEPDCKINALIERVVRIYQESEAQQGTQLIFCDLSTPKGRSRSAPSTTQAEGADDDSAVEQAQRGLVYHEIRQKLIEQGIPQAEIAFIHEHSSRTRREKLFADVRAGRVRMLLGSTARMGTGMNVQDRLIALHHLDAPWRPCDIEQREGRMLRQGNRWPEVSIYQYITEGSFDAYLWQLLENKARFISQIMAGEISQRTAEDVAEVVLSAAEIKALATGNPKIVQKVQLDAERGRLERVRSVWLHGRLAAQREQERHPRRLAELASEIAALQRAIAARDQQRGRFALTVITPTSSTTFSERAAAGNALRKAIHAWHVHATERRTSLVCRIAHYQGLCLDMQLARFHSDLREPELLMVFDNAGQSLTLATIKGDSAMGMIASLDHHIRRLEEQVATRQRTQRDLEQRQSALAASIARPWDGMATYSRVMHELQRLDAELNGETASLGEDSTLEMDTLLAEARALTAEPDAGAECAGEHTMTPLPADKQVPTDEMQVAASSPADLTEQHPQPAATATFAELAWMRAAPARRKPTQTSPPTPPFEQLRLFE